MVSRASFFFPLRRVFAAFALLAAFALVCAFSGEALAARKKAQKDNPKYAAIVMDAETGRILSQSNPDKVLHPASLTKVMTLLLAFDALREGRMSLRDRIEISEHAASMVPTKLGIRPGGTIRVEDAIRAMITKSANDVSVAMAEALGGTETRFARMMTARARQIGMTRTVFVNASGLHHPHQVSTARDMALLARHVIRDYPDYYRMFSIRSFKYGGEVMRNHNRLMETYRGMDGMKTGYIGPSGFNLVASAVRDDRRLIGVVFGGRSTASRNARMAQLLDQGFADLAKGRKGVLVAENVEARPPVPIPPSKPDSAPQVRESGIVVSSVEVVPADGSGARLDAFSVPAAEIGAEGGKVGALGLDTPYSGESRDPDLVESVNFVASVKNAARKTAGAKNARLSPSDRTDPRGAWSIQIGAYGDSTATARMLRDALGALPEELATAARAVVSPLKTGAGDTIYRARLAGYARNDAIRACRHFRDCLVIAPRHD